MTDVLLELAITVLLGTLLLIWGMRFGRVLLRKGATANDLFKDKPAVSMAFLGIYLSLLLLVLNVPQFQSLPLEWRFYGMRVTWTLMRVILLGACGMGLMVSWHTARSQVIGVVLLGLVGLGGFTGVEFYFLAPIYASLQNHLHSNGIFEQTSNSSCAPTAMATLLREWGVDATESEVARLAGTSRMGTTMPQLIIAAQAMGLDGLELSPTWEQMQQINRPGILGVWLIDGERKLPHAVALLGLNADIATVADPATGLLTYLDRSTFSKLWRQQYVPFYRPNEVRLTPIEAATQLYQLGYLPTAQPVSGLNKAIRHFQTAEGIQATGDLDVETVLLLSGHFLTDAPRLDQFITTKAPFKFRLSVHEVEGLRGNHQ
jgi:predicted double-glycine peptidase